MTNRRNFCIYTASTLFTSITLCAYNHKVNLLKEPYQTFFLLYKDLFEIKPSLFSSTRYFFETNIYPPKVSELHAISYLEGVLHDKRLEASHREYILKGKQWLNESSQELFKANYIELAYDKRVVVLEHINQFSWGDNWLYIIMGYYFEAMLSAPVYGANERKSGWDWLEYVAGHPQPKTQKDIEYEA